MTVLLKRFQFNNLFIKCSLNFCWSRQIALYHHKISFSYYLLIHSSLFLVIFVNLSLCSIIFVFSFLLSFISSSYSYLLVYLSLPTPGTVTISPATMGSVVTFFFNKLLRFNYSTKDKLLVFVHRQMSTLL